MKNASLHSFRLALGLALTAVLLALGAWALHAAAPPDPARPPRPPETSEVLPTLPDAAPGKLVVAVSPGTDEATLAGLLARAGATLDRWLPRLGLALVDVPPGAEARIAAALAGDPTVDFVTGYLKSVRIADVPLDQYFPQQWGMVKVQGPAAWDLAWSYSGMVVAVVDTGVHQGQQDLRDRTWYNPGETAINPATGLRDCSQPISYNGIDDDDNGYVDDCRGWNFVSPPGNNPMDGNGHGTAVAGIIAATANNYDPIIQAYAGVAGMARGASLMALRALDDYGTGYTFDIAAAIDYAAADGARVINLSLTLPVANPNPNDVEILRRAVTAAQSAGVTVVAAAGNDSYEGMPYPAAFPGVLAVGASTQADTRASFSNYGSRLDLVAPGVEIVSTLVGPGNQSYGLYNGTGSGTSFATPHVAGVTALVRSLRPDLSQGTVYELVRRSADDVGDPGWDPQTGWGRLNAYRAVAEALYGLNLNLAADPPTVSVGGRTVVWLQITAPGQGQMANSKWQIANGKLQSAICNLPSAICHLPSAIPAGFGARVTFTSSIGTITPTLVTADAAGRASLLFVADVFTGTEEITATLGGVTATLPVTVTSGLPAALELAAGPSRIATGGHQATITATVRDEGGSSALDGTLVAFTTTLGTLSAFTGMTTSGVATVTLTSGNESGTAYVEATTNGLTATVAVDIVGAGRPFSMTLVAVPAAIAVDDAGAAITATVYDGLGGPVADGTPVHFTSDRGALTSTDVSTAGGQAGTRLLPGTLPGPAHVVATAGDAAGETWVTIGPGAAFTVTMTANPPELVAGYNQISLLRTTVTDRYSNPVADGTLVTFTSTLGLVTPATITTTGGMAEATLIGELVAGTSTITATAPNGAAGRIQVRIRPAAPASLALNVSPQTIGVGGQVATLTTTVRDPYGNAVADGTAVEFSTDLGELRAGQIANSKWQMADGRWQMADGEWQIADSKWQGAGDLVLATVTLTLTTTSGTAVAGLVSGPVAGTAHVRVAVAPNLLQTAEVSIRPGGPMTVTLTANPPRVLVGGRVQLVATVTDGYGNPVADGTVVRFAVNRGRLDQTEVGTLAGVASTWFTADRQPGSISAVAISGYASGFGTVEVEMVRRYVPLMIR